MTTAPPAGARFEPGPDPGLDDLRIVARGTVHRLHCPKVPSGATAAPWRPAMAGLDDRPCLYCFPDMGGHQ